MTSYIAIGAGLERTVTLVVHLINKLRPSVITGSVIQSSISTELLNAVGGLRPNCEKFSSPN